MNTNDMSAPTSSKCLSDRSKPPSRVFRRDWKRYKPHLPKSTSLPALQLEPHHRPLFQCKHCGFANTLVPLCLWCAWTSAEATRVFEEALPRCRRLSAPAKIVWNACRVIDDYPKDVQKHKSASLDSVASSLPPVTPQYDSFKGYTPTTASVLLGSDDQLQDTGCGSQDELMRSQEASWQKRGSGRASPVRADCRNIVAKVVTPAVDDTLYSQKGAGRSMEIAGQSPETYRHLSSTFHTSRDTKPLALTNHIKSRSESCTYAVGGLKGFHLQCDGLEEEETLPKPHRKLQRKRRMAVMKHKSSSSLRRKAALSQLTSVSAPAGSSSGNSKLRRSDDGPHVVRLGHPSRPYYTAIRPSMSRPSSPFDPPANPHPRTPRPASMSAIPNTRSGNGRHSFVLSLHYPSRPSSPAPATSGFSLSGETELHMALAQWRTQEVPGTDSEYRFSRKEKRWSMTGKMKKIGKGLKDLMLGRF